MGAILPGEANLDADCLWNGALFEAESTQGHSAYVRAARNEVPCVRAGLRANAGRWKCRRNSSHAQKNRMLAARDGRDYPLDRLHHRHRGRRAYESWGVEAHSRGIGIAILEKCRSGMSSAHYPKTLRWGQNRP